MSTTTTTPTNAAPVSPPACLHLDGYWINRAARTFRCYGCGCQFSLSEMSPRKRDIESWKPRR